MWGGEIVYHAFVEHSRFVAVHEVTEEGVYKEGQVPTTYGGAILKVEVVYGIIMVDWGGRVRRFEFDIVEPLDKDGKVGGPIIVDGVEVSAGAGPSTAPTYIKTVNSTLIDDDLRAKADKFRDINSGKFLTVKMPG